VSLAARLDEVRARIANACRGSGRDPASVGLVAVSKTRTVEECREAVALGQLDLGENYAQELRDKARAVPGARWHHIGPLQRKNVKYAVGTAVLIHSVDSIAIADEIAARAGKLAIVQRVLVQVNVAGEAQKSGCAIAELPELAEAIRRLPPLKLDGLMIIPPAEGDPTPHFRRLRELARELGVHELSMGMSQDFELAIAEGATLVRVGTAIFGERDYA
jgi:pyridoxal phosphate enzyme (YggS family)